MISATDPRAGGSCDMLIRGGRVFDGNGSPGVTADVAIHEGKVQAVGPALPQMGRREVDARGCWVMPGMLDIHTHYDAEIEAMPGLGESVRHGVTTIVMGNCSLSTALGSKKDVLDLFCRVESLPRDVLSKWLGEGLTWNGVREYYDHLESLPIGPNVASFIGHSNIRSTVMGMERSLSVAKAEPEEIRSMQKLVDDALAEGYLGLSIDMLPWHRLDGEPFVGISVPSQHAHPSEYRSLAKIVRRRDRVLQATPNALTKSTVAILGMLSTGIGRKSLRTTIVAAMDMKTDRRVYRIATIGGSVLNKLFRANIRWQTLAEPFLNYCDGVHTPLFEELPAGVDAISATASERSACSPIRSIAPRFAATGSRPALASFTAIWPTCGSSPRRWPARRASRSPSWLARPIAMRWISSSTCWPSTTRRCAGKPWSPTIGRRSGSSCSRTTPRCRASTTRAHTPATWPFKTAGCKCCSKCCSIPR